MKTEKVIIIGAGLCGSLLGIRLADLGYSVTVLEARPDIRKAKISAGRSINLALSDRGLKALKLAQIDREIQALLIPMNGRMLHNEYGGTRYSAYAGREHDYINSVSRTGLNAVLLDKLESYKHVDILFDQPCEKVYLAENKALIKDKNGNETWLYADLIFGADGAGSIVRHCMHKIAKKREIEFQDNSEFLTHGYKELSFPPSENNSWLIEEHALHIWPRGNFMMIALPNLDGSFTVTLFLPYEGTDYSFEHIEDKDNRKEFFEKYFPDAVDLFDNVDEEYENNPIGKLGTVRCYPWSLTDKSCLIGDAAHAIVPFYGQGMNCAFEDVAVLDKLIKKYRHHWPTILEQFSKQRKADAEAIADLAIDNFYEMRDHVAHADFARKRSLEMYLEKTYSDYYSKYSLVTFREDLPYSIALKLGRFQDEFILSKIRQSPEVDGDEIYRLLKEELTKHPFLELSEHS